jgi:hypothetical protein
LTSEILEMDSVADFTIPFSCIAGGSFSNRYVNGDGQMTLPVRIILYQGGINCRRGEAA